MQIALVGRTNDEVRKGDDRGGERDIRGARPGERFHWASTAGVLRFPSGAVGSVYSSENPEKLRGPQHDVAWCDEVGKWPRPDSTWDNLMLGLRLGERQRVVVTTTPRAIPLIRRILGDCEAVVTRGGTADNPDLSAQFIRSVQRSYGGTRLGRQELEGELIDDVEGALWTRLMVERGRSPVPAGVLRVVVGVEPAVGTGENADACGIVAVALGDDGIGYVVGDRSVQGRSPEQWARAVAGAADEFEATGGAADQDALNPARRGRGGWGSPLPLGRG